MIGMQYRINLPSDYDMQIIRKRVAENGNKTDGFPGLFFKCYLIQERNVDSFENIYSPLYIWNDSNGMNKFLFGGFYDNIIKSFGWQSIKVGIPLSLELKENFMDSKFVLEEKKSINPELSLMAFQEGIQKPSEADNGYAGRVCIYNPDKWEYSLFSFYIDRPENICYNNVYQILHISKGFERDNSQ